jgi:molybdopterin converting factor small subunit
MDIRVEFYGIPRTRAGVAHTRLEFATPSTTLAQVVRELARRFPDFGQQCADDGNLAPEVVANVSGDRFVRDSTTTIRDGETLLILSADAGG